MPIRHRNKFRPRNFQILGGIVALVSLRAMAAAQPCAPQWDPDFGQPGMDSRVRAMAVFDDGSGPGLYAGGQFETAGGQMARGLARWDGSTWTEVGGGVVGGGFDGTVLALVVLDDGGGPALFVGGFLVSAGGVPVNKVARWDGDSWSNLGPGLGSTVFDLAAFDDGTGPAVYACTDGSVDGPGGVWRFNGSDWSLVGGGITFHGEAATPILQVRALEVFDDGQGPSLYAGGLFSEAGGVAVSNLAKWDGVTWSDVDGGLNENVHVLQVFDDGSGPALYVGGTFLAAGMGVANKGEIPAIGLARWTGIQWEAFGNDDFTQEFFGIFAIRMFDDGAGTALYACGFNGVGPNRLYKWDGQGELSIASEHGGSTVYSLQAFDDGTTSALYMGGDFQSIDGVPAGNITRWIGCGSTTAIPALGAWGLVILIQAMLVAGSIVFRRRMPNEA